MSTRACAILPAYRFGCRENALIENPMCFLWPPRPNPLDFLRLDRLLSQRGGGHVRPADGPRRCRVAVPVHRIRLPVRTALGRTAIDRSVDGSVRSFTGEAGHRRPRCHGSVTDADRVAAPCARSRRGPVRDWAHPGAAPRLCGRGGCDPGRLRRDLIANSAGANQCWT